MEASTAISIWSDDETKLTGSDSESDPENDPDVNMCMDDDMEEPDCIDVGCDVDMLRDSDD